MVNLTRLSVLIADSDAQRSLETRERLATFGVRRALTVAAPDALAAVLQREAFDLLLCSDPLGETAGAEALRVARRLAPATRAVLMRADGATSTLTSADIDALPLPPSSSALQELLERTAAPQGGLWCEMPELSLPDILHIYHQARRSIHVLLSGPIAGRVRLEGGDIVDAESNELRGMAALSRLLEANTGLLRTEPASPGEPRTIWAPFESALLEAAQQLDERRRDSLLSMEAPREARESSEPPRPIETPAPSSDPASARPRAQGRAQRIMGGVLATLALAAAAAYLELRRERREGAATSARPQLGEPRDVEQTRRALAPAPPAPALPPASTPSAPGDDPHSSATASGVPAAPTPAESFELRLTSKPSRATVTEAGKVLGKTPLTLTIPRSSVAERPREFVLRSSGHRTTRVSQGAAEGIVRTHVVLGRRAVVPLAPVELPDAGGGPARADGSREDPKPGVRKEMRIRSRR